MLLTSIEVNLNRGMLALATRINNNIVSVQYWYSISATMYYYHKESTNGGLSMAVAGRSESTLVATGSLPSSPMKRPPPVADRGCKPLAESPGTQCCRSEC